MSGQRQPQTGYERILTHTANTYHILGGKVLTRLWDDVVKLDDLPEGAKIERVFQLFGSFGVELAKQARRVKLAEGLDLLNCSDPVVETCRIVNALESFRLELFFETSLLLALV
jgi:hypothetical protein